MHHIIGYRPDGKGKGTVHRISQVVKRSMGMLQGERECEDDEDDKGKVGGPKRLDVLVTFMGHILGPRSSRTTSARQKGKAPKKDKVKYEGGLKRVIKDADNWKEALAYLRALLRVAVCLGHIDNPFLLNSQRRATAIDDVWPQALSRANISASELEDARTKYSILTNVPVDLLVQYPTPATVYEQLCETAATLVAEHNDVGHPALMATLSDLCHIVATDVYRLGRSDN
ncbi:uncharacterized protein EDB93DRAFT_1249543 [Suillus bovinus]|uniref:uncharacterized protein n=1 Tax=Suillus bovinus TaxID=48563 RepID=UPI001B860173|nr:uncharacterized protein EDB93DRAFT_1249543 [Suillus bovinus]KAG2151048.1 hypothetical protein EDB93DRAFT_1249543 [Suillus bovinus]